VVLRNGPLIVVSEVSRGPQRHACYFLLAVLPSEHMTLLPPDGDPAQHPPRPLRRALRHGARQPDGGGPGPRVTVAGKHCESGDVLIREVHLPDDVAPGDLLCIPAAGAYTYSMASNYDRVPRPPPS
jgi:diaminopimelate decarboxylase